MKLSEIDLNLLVILDAIISERSVTAAGRRVGLSQPATSSALRRLRAIFDDSLLERSGARWRLTPLALELTEPLQQILGSIDITINRRKGFDPATSQRQFRIAAADDVAWVLVQPLLERLERVAPNVHVLITRPDNETGERLLNRQLDLTIEPEGRYKTRGFVTEKLYRDPWVVAAWAGNTQIGSRLTREQFFELGHVSASVRPYSFTLVERVIGGLSQKLDVQVVSESFSGLAMLLRGTKRIALMPGRLATKLKQAAELRILPPPLPLNDLGISMIWSTLLTPDAGHTWLRKQVAELARALERSTVLDQAM